MSTDLIKKLQSIAAERGLYQGQIDGISGPQTEKALEGLVGLLPPVVDASGGLPATQIRDQRSLSWGARVSQTFRDRVVWMCNELKAPAEAPSWLMACIAWESAETFSSGVINMAGSGAVGLIQFMPETAKGLGTTVQDLAKLTPEDQLNFVYRHFKPFTGRLNTLADFYMAILWPAAVGKPDDIALWDQTTRPTTYRQNAGLDVNKNGVITKREAAAKVQEKLAKGYLPGNVLKGV